MRLRLPGAVALGATLALAPGQPPPYRNPQLPTAERVADLLARMTLEEKFWQVFMLPGSLDDPAHDYSNGVFGLQISASIRKGDASSIARAHAERINTIQRFFVERTRLGIPIIPFDEAVHGLAREGATMFPQAIALAATWDAPLVERVAAAIARESGSRGIRQVLSPVVNIADDVRWGRVEETYGEDPLLASAMGRAFIEPFERAGIVTTPKHFVANVGEGGRDSYPIDHSERLLTERFFPPFEAAVRRARARSVMSAYNSVDGEPATQSARLLNGILKREWGFPGFVISDASATGGATVLHMTEPNTPVAAQHAFEGRTRRRVPVVLRPAAAVLRGIHARADRPGSHRCGGRAGAPREFELVALPRELRGRRARPGTLGPAGAACQHRQCRAAGESRDGSWRDGIAIPGDRSRGPRTRGRSTRSWAAIRNVWRQRQGADSCSLARTP
jgi:hypothetical protein